MKRIRLFQLVLLLATVLTTPFLGIAHETEEPGIEYWSDFLPLEVGNRWTFEHWYLNEMFFFAESFHKHPERWGEGEELTNWKAFLKQFEIPGYPPLGESVPPESLTHPDKVVISVEITHKEHVDGFDYFVFSEPSYAWPPLPTFFWAGQKVRISEDGILHLHRNETDIPLYDFRTPSEVWHRYEVTPVPATPASALGYISRSEVIEMARWLGDRLSFPVYPNHLEVEKNPEYQDQFLEIGFSFSNATFYAPRFWSAWRVLFVNGYGLGFFERNEEAGIFFLNQLYPVSAVLSGNEIPFEEAAEDLVLLIEPEFPPIVGQRDTLHIGMGFDFTEETSGYYREKDDVRLDQLSDGHGGSAGPPFLESYVSQVADLGQVDFERLASEGPSSGLQADPDSRSLRPQEGNTYAFWTQEGGVALVLVLDIVTSRWGESVIYILFDWIYYPPSEKDTSIKSTSWGELKKTLRKK